MPDVVDTTGRAAARSKAVAALKPTIDVIIDRHYNSKVYTSGSVIAGRAIVKAVRDTAFDHFDIVFTGIAATRLDFVQQYPSHSFRPFLKMRMPISEDDMPEDRVFKAGRTYTIPFHFVIPHQLPIGACKHQCEDGPVLDHHLRLPPTIGFWSADDQAPEMAQIEYAVKARAVKQAQGDVPASKVMEGQHVVKVLPASPEDAPLDITFRDERYTMAKTKTIRKNLFSAKTGKLTAASMQPEAVMFSADGRDASLSTAHINLEFVPDSVDTAPPKINSVSAKLLSTTFFGAAPVNYLPNLGPRTAYHSNPCLNYTTTNNLFNNPVDKISWLQEKVDAGRRDSGYSSSHLSPDSDAMGKSGNKKTASPIKHVASLDVPFTVTNNNRKIFLPTFHSCLISRTYVLQLCLSVGPTNTTLTLSVPVQVGVETAHDDPQGGELPSFESVMARDQEAEADSYLRPRIRRAASEDAPQTNSLLPGYNELSRRSAMPVAPVA